MYSIVNFFLENIQYGSFCLVIGEFNSFICIMIEEIFRLFSDILFCVIYYALYVSLFLNSLFLPVAENCLLFNFLGATQHLHKFLSLSLGISYRLSLCLPKSGTRNSHLASLASRVQACHQ